MDNQIVTATLDSDMYHNLELLADTTSCSKSELIAEAIRIYLEDQSWQIEAVKNGIQEADTGNFSASEKLREVFLKWSVSEEFHGARKWPFKLQ